MGILMIGRIVLVASVILASSLVMRGNARAQDVPGIEICTVEKTMERRTSCLQSNVDFLMKTISKLGADHQQKLDAANRQIDGLKAVVQKMGSADIDELLKAAALLAEQDYVALLGSETGKLVAAVGKSGLEKGIKAGNIIKAAAKALGGGGGGKPDLAQGGGPNVERLDEALRAGCEAMRASS
jgi:alanyl-tRNA synthetase